MAVVHGNDLSGQGVSAKRFRVVRICIVEDPVTNIRPPDLA